MATSLFEEFQPHSKEVWKNQAIKDLKGKDFEQTLIWQAEGDLRIEPFYSPEDLSSLPADLIQSAQKNTAIASWHNREKIIFSTEKETNQLILEAIEWGADSVIIDFEEKNITTINFKQLLHQIKLSEVYVFFKVQNQSLQLLETLASLIPYQMKGGVQDDYLATWMHTGELSKDSTTLLAHSIRKVQNHPQFKTLLVSGEVFHNAGANSVQEIAFTLANALEYIDQLTEAGLSLEEILHKLEFGLAIGTDYFIEIAKIRALRYLWQKVLSEGYAFDKANEFPAMITAYTSSYFDAALTPNTNMLRATTEAMSAIIGGADALVLHAYNSTFEQEEGFGKRIARNISTILKEESYLDKVNDASAGSYYIEHLTFELAQKALILLQKVAALGGSIAAFEQGFTQNAIAETHRHRQEATTSGKRILVGVNKFRFDEKPFVYEAKEEYSSSIPLLSAQRLSEVVESQA
ncbi:MAG: methylmalonyl-CoA mutase family protein [Flectobacillus sp.]|uniref:methylmalonyl-CoA mutase family protein n=1 Tax=Flectobacillus sp. TaxID=50419 RepID=UPI003B9ADB0F